MKAQAVLCAVLAFALSSCQLPVKEVVRKPILVQPSDASQGPLYVWHGTGSADGGRVYVTIDLSQQKAYVFKNRQPIGWSYVATGRRGYATPTGTFYVSEKKVQKRSSKYGSIVNSAGQVVVRDATAGVHGGGRFVGAPMPYWMRLTNYGIGMHAGPIPNPGSPASHGCIRLPYSMAQRLYAEAPTGTRVTIVP
jgi:lipoprotein-anchoring transpeptidase ErfK/SrfK